MRITVEIVHKSQLPQLFTNRKWQMAPSICIGGNGGICEQLRFVNNEVIGKPAARAAHGNEHEDDFYCFRCWEIKRLGVSELGRMYQKSPSLLNSKTPSSESKKGTIIKL